MSTVNYNGTDLVFLDSPPDVLLADVGLRGIARHHIHIGNVVDGDPVLDFKSMAGAAGAEFRSAKAVFRLPIYNPYALGTTPPPPPPSTGIVFLSVSRPSAADYLVELPGAWGGFPGSSNTHRA